MKKRILITSTFCLTIMLLSCSRKDCYQCKLPGDNYLEKMCNDVYTIEALTEAKGTCLAAGGTWYYNDKETVN